MITWPFPIALLPTSSKDQRLSPSYRHGLCLSSGVFVPSLLLAMHMSNSLPILSRSEPYFHHIFTPQDMGQYIEHFRSSLILL